MTIKQICLLLLSCLVVFINVWAQQNTRSIPDVSCMKNLCSCCLPNVYCSDGSGNCAHQCKVGYHGGRCWNKCPEKCNECTDVENTTVLGHANCTNCKDGYYSTPDSYQCQSSCPDGCQRCINRTDCISCKTGYYKSGSTCSPCQPGCKTCTSNYTCSTCKERRYGNQCNFNCSINCNNTCDRTSGFCDSCVLGFTGNKCCMQGPGCQSCSSESVCSECVAGKHGKRCGSDCPERCANKICDKINGACITCLDGFQGMNCTIPKPSADFPAAAIGAAVAGFVILIFVVAFLVIRFKQRKRNKASRAMTNTEDMPTDRVCAKDVTTAAAAMTSCTSKGLANPETPSSVASSLTKVNTGQSSTEKRKTKERMDASVKSDNGSKLNEPEKPHLGGNKRKPTKPDVVTMDHRPYNQSPEVEGETDYYNCGSSFEKGIPVSVLAAYVDEKDSEFYKTEFAKLPKGLVKSTDAALLDQNIGKNRYNGIYPYDETRVVLAGPVSDYINACYIEGYGRKRGYIAALGPISKATDGYMTFWQMVWQEKTDKIVMVTNLVEGGGMKCEQYWPDKNATLTYGDIKVRCHSEDVYAEYTVRSFTVQKMKEERSLHHIHYTAWPDKGVPDDVTSLVEFRNKVNSTKTTLNGPIIVHCSAGVGRTGTYIALDILTLKGKQKGFVDIFECVEKLRQQRTYMVQTDEQYEYLHRALVHTLTLGSGAIPANNFQAYTASLSDAVFDRLSHCKEKISEEEMFAVEENKAKKAYNRPGADVPGDSNRPRLYGRTTEDSNYINAVFVNSFKQKNQFILTQTPLPNTVDDFLTLVLQQNCCCIVSMDAPDISDKSIGTYIPADNQILCTEAFEVKITKLESNRSYNQRTLTITSKNTPSTITVAHFLCANWSDKEKTPKSSTEFLTLVKQIQKIADESAQFSPVIVHCRTGSERSALLCVVLNVLQKIEIEHEVSVINTVRQVKVRRSKAIPNKEQFKFCHQCVSSYLQSFDIYSNFN